jgi:hypothetical protein
VQSTGRRCRAHRLHAGRARSTQTTRCAAIVALALTLTACTERFTGFTVEHAQTDRFRIAAMPPQPQPQVLLFRVAPRTLSTDDGPIHAKPAGSVLKVAGYAPVTAEQVVEDDGGFTVRFQLPKDLVKTASSGLVARQNGEIWIPLEATARSWSGVEHRSPATLYASLALSPGYSGPLTSAAKGVFESLRGLYQAR